MTDLITPTEKDIEEVKEWLNLKLTTGKISNLLIDQLAEGMINRTLHVHNIYDEIGALEGAPGSRSTNTKPATAFRRRKSPLRGLFHKHYTDPSHILKISEFIGARISSDVHSSKMKSWLDKKLSKLHRKYVIGSRTI